jgi:hypothetical protein
LLPLAILGGSLDLALSFSSEAFRESGGGKRGREEEAAEDVADEEGETPGRDGAVDSREAVDIFKQSSWPTRLYFVYSKN